MSHLDPGTMKRRGFIKQSADDVAGDELASLWAGAYEIALCIPNGGILGVSIRRRETNEYWSKPTEGTPDFPGYDNREGHVAIAEAAISKALELYDCDDFDDDDNAFPYITGYGATE